MVRRDDDHAGVESSGFPEPLEESTQLCIDVGEGPIVTGDQLSPRGGREGPEEIEHRVGETHLDLGMSFSVALGEAGRRAIVVDVEEM